MHTQLAVITLNVGVYMMGGMYITELDLKRMDTYIQSQVKFFQELFHLSSPWIINGTVTYLHPEISVEISRLLCLRILSNMCR